MVRNKRAQTIVEYAVLMTIILVVFLVMMTYIKRGMQGRWKSSVDDLGEQYDPRYVNGYTLYTYTSQQNSEVHAVPDKDGWWTNRVDSSVSQDSKKGFMSVGVPCKGEECLEPAKN